MPLLSLQCTHLLPFVYRVQSESVDIKALRQECAKKCPKVQQLYDDCVKRITETKQGDCEGWFFDVLHCVDKCVAPKVFQLTKE